MKKNRLLLIVFILVTTAVTLVFFGLRKFSEFKTENYLKPAKAKNEIVKLMTAVLIYEQEQGILPSKEVFKNLKNYQPQTSVVLQIPPDLDPWGAPYEFKVPGPEDLPYSIISYGADKKPGGAGKDADITSDPVYQKYKKQLNNSSSPEE